jgi:hypothetical protein
LDGADELPMIYKAEFKFVEGSQQLIQTVGGTLVIVTLLPPDTIS